MQETAGRFQNSGRARSIMLTAKGERRIRSSAGTRADDYLTSLSARKS